MELEAWLRGQSNAYLMVGGDLQGAGGAALVAEAQRLLGFDGVNDTVRLRADWYTPGRETIVSSTAFLGDWVAPDGAGGWQALAPEQGLLAQMAEAPNPGAAATAVVWLHSEYDSLDPGLSQADWESAVRADAGWVRGALGREAADSPYLFVDAISFGGASDAATQAIRAGMEALADDPAFHGAIGARALDIDMSFRFPSETHDILYGAAHMALEDTVQTGWRLGRALAQEWAEYAKPGSPVALAGGQVADAGPEVVSAALIGAGTILVTVAHDAPAWGFLPLDQDAAAGAGWTVRGADGALLASAGRVEVLSPTTLSLELDAALPAGGGTLFYGHGYGRLAPQDVPAIGNAIYDSEGLPIWTPATGVAVTVGGDGPGAATIDLGSGPDALVLRISQDAWLGDAQYAVTVDGVAIGGVLTAAAIHGAGASDTVTLRGDWGPGAHAVTLTFLNDAWGGTADTDRNLHLDGLSFNGAEQPGGAATLWSAGALERGFGDAGGNPVLEGTAGPDALAGTAGADGIRGGPGADTLVGGAGADTFLLAEGGGQDRVEDFERGIDQLLLEGGIDPASVWTQATALDGVQGRAVHYGWAGDMVFLAGVWELTGGDIAFA